MKDLKQQAEERAKSEIVSGKYYWVRTENGKEIASNDRDWETWMT